MGTLLPSVQTHRTKGYSSQTYVIPATPLFVPGGADLAAELACSEEGGGGDTLVAHPRVQAHLRALLRCARQSIGGLTGQARCCRAGLGHRVLPFVLACRCVPPFLATPGSPCMHAPRRPCCKQPQEEEEGAEQAAAPAAPEEAADGPSSGDPVPMDAAPGSEGAAAAAAAASTAGEGDGEAMEVEQAQPSQQEQQAQQEQQEQQEQQQDAQQQRQQEQADGGAFDMWAPQVSPGGP